MTNAIHTEEGNEGAKEVNVNFNNRHGCKWHWGVEAGLAIVDGMGVCLPMTLEVPALRFRSGSVNIQICGSWTICYFFSHLLTGLTYAFIFKNDLEIAFRSAARRRCRHSSFDRKKTANGAIIIIIIINERERIPVSCDTIRIEKLLWVGFNWSRRTCREQEVSQI